MSFSDAPVVKFSKKIMPNKAQTDATLTKTRTNETYIIMLKLNRSTLSVIAFLAGAFVMGAQNRTSSEGSTPYIPTRLEWLALDLNSKLRTDIRGPDRFDLMFAGFSNEDTILVLVRYLPTVNREAMNTRIEGAKQYIEVERKGRGWPWLKIREDVKMQELPVK